MFRLVSLGSLSYRFGLMSQINYFSDTFETGTITFGLAIFPIVHLVREITFVTFHSQLSFAEN